MKSQAGIGPWFEHTTSITNTALVPLSFKFVPLSLQDVLPSGACVVHIC